MPATKPPAEHCAAKGEKPVSACHQNGLFAYRFSCTCSAPASWNSNRRCPSGLEPGRLLVKVTLDFANVCVALGSPGIACKLRRFNCRPLRAQCQIEHRGRLPIRQPRTASIGCSICRGAPATGQNGGAGQGRLHGSTALLIDRHVPPQFALSGELKWPRDNCAAIVNRKSPRRTRPSPPRRLRLLAERRESHPFPRPSRSSTGPARAANRRFLRISD